MIECDVNIVAKQVMEGGWVVWEDGKYVSVSQRRFLSLKEDREAGSLHVKLRGAAKEVVQLIALRPNAGAFAARSERAKPRLEKKATPEWTVLTMNATVGLDGTTSLVVQ